MKRLLDRSARSSKRVKMSGQKFGDRIVLRIEDKWFVKKWQDADGNELEKPWLGETLGEFDTEAEALNWIDDN